MSQYCFVIYAAIAILFVLSSSQKEAAAKPVILSADSSQPIIEGKASLSLAQCTAACRAGVTAMEAFCRLVPHPATKALCWAVTLYAGTPSVAACTGFCYNNF
ncbi:unnamed protein product [Rotaria sp. Silwood2]|nr:unnamed protein product [Rotaria sp. Silwood2]CAF4319449.1 unnamed protein product [Rotaria sp. Silwood2]